MGKDTVWIRVANRGSCPRNRLLNFGVSDDKKVVDSTNPHGIFRSGAKIAPLVALRHGLEMRVVTNDAKGGYCLRYEARVSEEDPSFRQYVIICQNKGGATKEIPMPFNVDSSFKNWSDPIGDDPLAEFPVWREAFNNARGKDANGPLLTETDEVAWSPRDLHCVYIRKTADYEAIMANSDRYFKWLSGVRPLMSINGTDGRVALRIFPKSEEDATRLFAHGTLAYCSKAGADRSLFDYSFDIENLMTEERVFANLSVIYQWLGIALAALRDKTLIVQLLVAMQCGDAAFEEHALSYTTHLERIGGADAWSSVWKETYGDNAVMSNPGFGDEYVLTTFNKNPILVLSPTLRAFLRRCGVQEANDFAPKMIEGTTFNVVELDDEEKKRARDVFDAIRKEYPAVKLPIYPYEPIGNAMAGVLGFVQRAGDGASLGIYILKRMYKSTRWLMLVVNHEYRHVRTDARDLTLRFEDCADQDEARLLLEKHWITDDTPSETEISLEEIALFSDEPENA